MTEPAAIHGNLVDVRNIISDKCVKLTIHVSAERAMQVLEAFGWPTNVDPVLVAIARLDPDIATQSTEASKPSVPTNHRLSQQAAMCCQNELFWRFLETKALWKTGVINCQEDAAIVVRDLTVVNSRSEFDSQERAASEWKAMHGEFLIWSKAA